MPPRSIRQYAESITSLKRQSIMNMRSGIFFLWMCVMLSMPVFAQQAVSLKAAPACPAILQHQFPKLQDGSLQNLCQYAGKAVLVVNTASYCGFTGQYEGLEALYAKYEKQGLVVLGFPSNDFGKQEPGSSKEIADFCFNTYGVKFPMFSKSVVSGSGKNALFTALKKATGVAPKWNFHKYLIDQNGKVVGTFSSEMEPQNPKLVSAVERVLK